MGPPRRGRIAKTAPGKRAALPAGVFEPRERIRELDGVFELDFIGNDQRLKTYRTTTWLLPHLHEPLIEGLHAATGYSGSARTERSATGLWVNARLFVNFLGTVESPPGRIADVAPSHFRAYAKNLLEQGADPDSVVGRRRNLRVLFMSIPARHGVTDDVLSYLSRRDTKTRSNGVGGYDDETFQRIVTAARSDVVEIRKRLRAGRAFAARHAANPNETPPELTALGDKLVELVETGDVRAPGRIRMGTTETERLALAANVYLVKDDLIPLMVLLAAVSGHNSETLKELPAAHSVFNAGAVQIEIVKRRRGDGNWFDEIHWEVGKASRELHTAGGLYLLYDELCAPGRLWAGTDRLWAVWTNPRPRSPVANRYPWEASLAGPTLDLGGWAANHGITENEKPLRLTFNRLRTTYLRRATRDVGGHLPSAAKLNTQDVLFKNYLAGDSTARSWAEGVIAETFHDIEAQIRDERGEALEESGGHLSTRLETAATDEAAYLSCRDIRHGPHTPGAPCGASALACFSCPNALIGEQHLPKLLHLKAELEDRWGAMDAPTWWARYGSAWIAIQEDIMPRFSEAELASIEVDRSIRLSLLEDPV